MAPFIHTCRTVKTMCAAFVVNGISNLVATQKKSQTGPVLSSMNAVEQNVLTVCRLQTLSLIQIQMQCCTTHHVILSVFVSYLL